MPLFGPLLLRGLHGLLRGEDGSLLRQGSLEEEAAGAWSWIKVGKLNLGSSRCD